MRLLVACALCAVLFSCQCGSIVIGGGHGGGHGGGSGGSGGSGGGTGMPCTTMADCGTGACIDGMCCLAPSVCGKVCCGGASVCLFNACVTPGKDCHTANDCGMGEYCETALGEPSNTELDAGMCTQPLPAGGKCLTLPPLCSGADDGGCIAPCEYHAPVGQLNAVARWQWGPTATNKPDYTDVWSTPVVGRVHDSNCDGVVNELDAPVLVFVSGNDFANAPTGSNCQGAAVVAMGPTMCHTSVLRMIDGASGKEIWTLEKASMSSMGFAGVSPAIGDIDNDGNVDIVAVTGEGSVVLIDSNGVVKRTSNVPIPGATDPTFGWGGGLAVADMDGDGFPEIAYGSTVFSTTGGAITLKFTGMGGIGGGAIYQALATFADLDLAADGHLELLAGNTAYTFAGTVLWSDTSLPDGFPGVGDFDKDGKPEVALVGSGKLWILDAATGAIRLGPVTLPGTGSGGPPTVADFDGDGKPEVGIAMATFYSVLKPDFAGMKIDVLWSTPNHDLSSSVTGSTVFDFEGDGKAEVIYNDECFLWVFDGKTGAVRFAASTSSFTGTEASLVADVDGDGRAEMVMISNGANPANGSGGWGCLDASGNPVTMNGHTWVPTTFSNKSHRGITLFGDSAHSWVGTRTLWSEHTYHVSNICDDRDSACPAPNVYGSIPKKETHNWTLSWLNNFRQNVQDKGLFDAPDATVSLTLECGTTLIAHVSVRNIGVASLPAGVTVGVFTMGGTTPLATGITTHALFSGQIQTVDVPLPGASTTDTYVAKIIIDPMAPTFHECREDNDESLPVTPACIL